MNLKVKPIRLHNLEAFRLADGTIRMSQQAGIDEASVIDLHPSQLRQVAEQFGLVEPNYPADELSKRLARQLCEIQRELADECHRSHWLGLTFAKLDGFCSSLPDSVFPHDLWDEPPATESPTAKPLPPASPPEPTASSDVQLDLL